MNCLDCKEAAWSFDKAWLFIVEEFTQKTVTNVLQTFLYCGFNSVEFTSQEILLNQTFRQLTAVFFSGCNTVCGCGGYKVNGVTGDDEVGDVTGDNVW